MRRVATMLLDTYVGHRSGERISRGSIHCGDIQGVEAVRVMLVDVRGFTAFANTHPAEAAITPGQHLLRLLRAGDRRGGRRGLEVHGRRAAGDGALLIEGRTREAACGAALSAREAIATAVGKSQERRVPPLAYGVALHLGEVLYGNIGAGHRLDFTAMGPVVNKAARLEALAGGGFGRPLLTSADFARHAGRPLRPLGRWPLKGFPEPGAVFGLPTGSAG